MQKIKLDNGCKYLQISELSAKEYNEPTVCYIYRCSAKDSILHFGIFNCHKCDLYEEDNNE